jgi:hypothetical protein
MTSLSIDHLAGLDFKALTVDMSAFGRPTAHGTVVDGSSITVTFPDDKTYTGQLQSPNKIRWSNGSVWTKVINKREGDALGSIEVDDQLDFHRLVNRFAGAETVFMVERNMSNAAMRGIASSRPGSRAQGARRKLGYLVSGRWRRVGAAYGGPRPYRYSGDASSHTHSGHQARLDPAVPIYAARLGLA